MKLSLGVAALVAIAVAGGGAPSGSADTTVRAAAPRAATDLATRANALSTPTVDQTRPSPLGANAPQGRWYIPDGLRHAGTVSGRPSTTFRSGAIPRAARKTIAAPLAPKSPLTPNVVLFNNLNSAGMSADNVSPPDSTGAVGPNNYVEMDNANIAVYDRSLNLLSTKDLTTFATTVLPGGGWCDVQIQWDPTAGRWLVAFLLCNGNASVQGFVMGWSKTADPSDLVNGWCLWGFGTQPDFLDYPKLGHNSSWMLLGGNVFDSNNPANFLTAAVVWAHLPANGATSCGTFPQNHGTIGTLLNGDGSQAFTPIPVNNIAGLANGYIVAAYAPPQPPSIATANKIAVFHVDAAGSFHHDADVTVNAYAFPPAAAQMGNANVIDTLDGRLTQAVADASGGIWTQHTVLNGSATKVTWYELTPASGTNLQKAQEGDITSGTDFVFNGAISPTYAGGGAAVIEYNRSSTSYFPLIAAQVRTAGTPAGTMSSGELVLKTSAAPDADFTCTAPFGPPCRWGDYSGATPDPKVSYAVWGTNMFLNAQNGTAAVWQDENFALTDWIAPGVPTGLVATGGTVACLAWTPSALDDGGAPTVSYTVRAYLLGVLKATLVVSGAATIACIGSLAEGTYTLTVMATDAAGSSPESSMSSAVAVARSMSQSGGNSAGSRGANQSSGGTPGPR